MIKHAEITFAVSYENTRIVDIVKDIQEQVTKHPLTVRYTVSVKDDSGKLKAKYKRHGNK